VPAGTVGRVARSLPDGFFEVAFPDVKAKNKRTATPVLFSIPADRLLRVKVRRKTKAGASGGASSTSDAQASGHRRESSSLDRPLGEQTSRLSRSEGPHAVPNNNSFQEREEEGEVEGISRTSLLAAQQPTTVLVLADMLDEQVLLDDKEHADVCMDVTAECSEFGEVHAN